MQQRAAGKWDFDQQVLAGTVPQAVFGGKFRENPFAPPPPPDPEAKKRESKWAWKELIAVMRRDTLAKRKRTQCPPSKPAPRPSPKD